MDIAKVTEQYYENNAEKLHKMVDKILKGFGGLSQKDTDDFYSLANEVFVHAVNDFNGRGDFNGFFYSRLCLKIRTLMTERNRQKRSDVEVVTRADGTKETVYHPTLSLDAPVSNDEGASTIYDLLVSDFNIWDEISRDLFLGDNGYSESINKYMDSLTSVQRKVAHFIMEGLDKKEIQQRLNLSEKKYQRIISNMKGKEKTKHLRRANNQECMEENNMDQNQLTTLETNKDTKLSVASIIKKIDNCTIRFDHPLQRSSEQWTKTMKGNLISDILQGNPIPEIVLAEQVINNLGMIWDIDGKQRCTNVHSFKNDEYKVSKNITRPIIEYQAIMRDEDKKPVLDEKGFPKSERKTFDIRNKKFSELPEELQDKFLDYDFKIVQYFNCTSDDIAYHIERYNSGRPMNTAQKGLTRLGEVYAEMVKNISAMSFFTELGGYKVSDSKNGALDRVIVESIMAVNFLNQWLKDQGEMCAFLKENANEDMFDNLEDMIDRLTNVGSEEFFDIFDSKNSFIYFTAFSNFIKFEDLGDQRFVDFMIDFNKELHTKEIGGVSFDNLNKKSTKDKSVVIAKINHLVALMEEYFGVSMKENHAECVEEKSIVDFVRETVEPNFEEEDIELFETTFDDYTVGVDNNSPLLSPQNRPSFIALVAYAFLKECDDSMEDWMVAYFNKHNKFIADQKENYIHMKKDLQAYLQLQEKQAV